MNRLDGRLDPARIAGPGAQVGDALVWDGGRWVPAAVATVHVGTAAPTNGSVLWYDTDDAC